MRRSIPLERSLARVLRRNLLVLIQQYESEAKNRGLPNDDRALAAVEATNLREVVARVEDLLALHDQGSRAA